MRSPFGALASAISAKAPIPYVGRSQPTFYRGQGVSAATAENQMRQFGASGTLHAIVTRLAQATSQVNWKLWRVAKSGKAEDRIEVTSHLALDIWNNPNPYYTRQEFVETFQQHLELTGEAPWIVERNAAYRSLPLALWPVRPDRMAPVPSIDDFISGYVYRGPDGERVPLEKDEVICLKLPNPLDPYRGLGPVQAILVDLDSARYGKEWNRNFFMNSAEPGGIVEVEKRLSDEEFEEMTMRWREQHQGVANAHRVAILEQGTWKERKYSQRDMEFVNLSNLTRENIREAFTFPKPLLGAVDDVNRANADAAEVVLARWLITPRLERIKGVLNNDFLSMFQGTGKGVVEFDYECPVPEDREAANAEMSAKANAAKTYIDAGFSRKAVCELLELPEMDAEAATDDAPQPVDEDENRALAEMIQKLYLGVDTVVTWEEARDILNRAGAGLDPNAPPPSKPEPASPFGAPPAEPAPPVPPKTIYQPKGAAPGPAPEIDLSGVQQAWESAVDALMGQWADVTDAQRAALVRQVRAIVESGDLSELASMTVPTERGARLLLQSMADLAHVAAAHVVNEARAQGVDIEPHVPTHGALAETAEFTAKMLGAELALSAAKEAMRVHSAGASAGEVADAVGTALRNLSDAAPRTAAGGALTGAQNAARIETFKRGPIAALYADETLDKNTCKPCRAINGRWLGNSVNGTDMEQIEKTYPTSGYVDCEGRSRCRGTITGVWRSKTVGE